MPHEWRGVAIFEAERILLAVADSPDIQVRKIQNIFVETR